MEPKEFYEGRNDYLKRLPPEYYRGQAYVHWTMTIHERKTGWLSPAFYYKFRELLTHTMFRYALCCPIYCCMPDHFHFIWMGILSGSDQRIAVKYFRKQLNLVLKKGDFKLQNQNSGEFCYLCFIKYLNETNKITTKADIRMKAPVL